MLARRSPFAIGLSTSLSTLALLISVIGVPQARAAIFDDDEARRQIKDLSIQTNERIDTLGKAQFELANQIQALREENAAVSRGEFFMAENGFDGSGVREEEPISPYGITASLAVNWPKAP